MHTHNVSLDSITPTGPKHNILKSDVLAAIGTIPSSVPAAQAERADKLAHLDLSNIVIAKQTSTQPADAPAPSSKVDPTQATAEEIEDELLPISVPISLAPLLNLQQKLAEKLGSAPSLSTLLARAVAVANTALPAVKNVPSTDELFDALLSPKPFKATPKVSDGKYVPMVANTSELPASELIGEVGEEDIYDVLTSAPKPRLNFPTSSVSSLPSEQPGAVNIFALFVTPEEEKRASMFLERLRDVVEANPGRLIGL